MTAGQFGPSVILSDATPRDRRCKRSSPMATGVQALLEISCLENSAAALGAVGQDAREPVGLESSMRTCIGLSLSGLPGLSRDRAFVTTPRRFGA